MTIFEALSLVAQFSLSIIAVLTLIVAIVVFLEKKSNRPTTNGWRLRTQIIWSAALYAVCMLQVLSS